MKQSILTVLLLAYIYSFGLPVIAQNTSTTVAAGAGHSLSILPDGTLWSWGSNRDYVLGESSAQSLRSSPKHIATTDKWKSVATYEDFALAIHADGTLWGWGSNKLGQLAQNGTYGSYVSPAKISANTTWASISAGNGYAVAIRKDGTLWAWGNNMSGKLGDGTNVSRFIPTQIGKETNWRMVSAGVASTIAIRADGTMWAWGVLNWNRAEPQFNEPIQVGNEHTWKFVAHRNKSVAAIKEDGTLWTWGENGNGELGTGTYNPGPDPKQITEATNWAYVSVGDTYMVATRLDGTLWHWGTNSHRFYIPGNENSTDIISQHLIPTQVGSQTTWKTVSAGDNHVLATQANGSVWAWGNGLGGAIGSSDILPHATTPNQVGKLTNWKSVATGREHTLALRTDGSLWSSGDNLQGQLGQGTTRFFSTMQQVAKGASWKQMTTGESHCLAVRTDGSLWAWGANDKGQLGDDTQTNRSSPIQVGNDFNWQYVAAGQKHSLGIKTDGTLWTWGQHADGTNTNILAPKRVGTSNTWKLVSAGYYHSLAIKNDGSLWSWGSNYFGQLGDGTGITRATPVQVGPVSVKWKSIAAGHDFSVGLREDGTLWAWGYNQDTQLGDGTRINRSAPVAIAKDQKWQAIGAGEQYGLAIDMQGTLWGWGYWGDRGLGISEPYPYYFRPIQLSTSSTWAQVDGGLYSSMLVQNNGTLWALGTNNLGGLLGVPGYAEEPLLVQPGTLPLATTTTFDTRAQLHVYPNPVQGVLRLEVKDLNTTLDLYDATGRVVRSIQPKPLTILSLQGIAPGVYILRQGQAAVRVVVQ
ncbi:T9SS type A sorting domain-containing protein [Hymenobacter sp. J193]|uniref:RCC1 domain-containing protein n=1 Tax=Hymenobacter sp. J193 TaxID=2898429 RepID=UPI00215168FA|nr:T9SS type A sorting domain-containing protein [Hymenobacter sp. J193]MCR5889341.1 T9SS type A sorting domain-containing protein [Hymenobacter sp. J193]